MIGDSKWGVNPAGFTVHSTLHRGIADAHCVMHTHTTAGCAVAGLRAGLSWDNFYSRTSNDRVAYHDFEGITVHADEEKATAAALDRQQACVILRNHGLGPHHRACLRDAVDAAARLPRSRSPVRPVDPVSDAIQRKASADDRFHPDHGGGKDVFDALVRLVDQCRHELQN